jgi:hypothetical protein
MKRFGISMSTAALGAALVAGGPALAFGGGRGGGGGGGFGGGHMGGGFGGGGFHNGGGFRGSHFGGFGGGPMFAGRSVATRGFNRGFDHRFANFNHFQHFHRFHNRFAFFPFFAGGLDYDYPYAECGYWGHWGNPYCGYGYSNYAYSYPDYGYDTSYYGNSYDNGYANGYDYPATGSSGYYSAVPLVTGRSVATGQLGSSCTISVKACALQHPSYGGGSCSCRVQGGHARGLVTR